LFLRQQILFQFYAVSAIAFNWSSKVIKIVAEFSFILVAESSITFMVSIDNLLITATAEQRLRNLPEVCRRCCFVQDKAKAKCFVCKFTASSIIASPQTKCGGSETGIKASDFGGINTASTLRSKVSFKLVKT